MKKALIGGVALASAMVWLEKSLFISHDLGMIRKLLGMKRAADAHIANNHTFVDIWQDAVANAPQKTFIVFEGYSYTYRQLDKQANRIAHWGKQIGIKNGETVALLMVNRPEYVACWLGLLKLGCTVALINFNVKGKPLVHSLKISGATRLLVGTEIMENAAAVSEDLIEVGFTIYAWGKPSNDRNLLNKKAPAPPISYAQNPALPQGWISLDDTMEMFSPNSVSSKLREGRKMTDTALLVYTSGTTGLPKAATIKHLRLFSMGSGFKTIFEVGADDRIFCVLPLYHSAGGLCGVGMTICANATMILNRKFSAKKFWPDCRASKATVVQYIGELCRYLLQVPAQRLDGKNSVRIAIGNGLRPEIWPEFQERFGIPQIGEFYGSTEGNAALFNHCKTKEAQGAVGRMGWLVSKILKMKVAKYDVENDELVRDPKTGFAVECKADEPGELLGPIDESDPFKRFDGYHGNKKATSKKVLRDAFVKGDCYFRTGDILKYDAKGYWYFVDRIGDTFRWKGENVSTNEVSQVLSVFPGVEEVNVYGVQIPGKDGRACMAAIVQQNIDWPSFAKHCADNLPPYAMPLFVRLLPRIQVTGTFKHQKVALRKEGADPTLVQDKIMSYDPAQKTYVPLDLAKWESIVAGRSRL